jgi:hypothetical protein
MTPGEQTDRLEELRRHWRMWSAVRADRRVDYRTLPITTDELAAADGDVVVAVYQVRDGRLTQIEAEAAALAADLAEWI